MIECSTVICLNLSQVSVKLMPTSAGSEVLVLVLTKLIHRTTKDLFLTCFP